MGNWIIKNICATKDDAYVDKDFTPALFAFQLKAINLSLKGNSIVDIREIHLEEM